MIRRLLCLLAAVVVCAFVSARSAAAQVGAYGMVTVEHMTGLSNSPYNAPGVAYNNSVDPIGFTGGVQYDLRTFGPVRLGVDARGAVLGTKRGAQTAAQGSGAHNYFALGGVRGTFRTRFDILAPYVEGAIGLGRSNFGVLSDGGVGSTSAFPGVQLRSGVEYHVFAGTDLHILPFADFRVVELGIGAIQGSGHSFPLYSVSSGLVLHLPRQ